MHAAWSADYVSARRRFIEGAEKAGLACGDFPHPLPGPDGAPGAADVVCAGPADAPAVLLANSGTHGVEGFLGSAVLSGWLEAGGAATLPAGVRVILIHGINPYGFAWIRRTDENNVDLNRNFIDFDRVPPENEAYAALHPSLLTEQWQEDAEEASDRALAGFIAEQGLPALQRAVQGGQYRFPAGLCYGGQGPSWSNLTFREILRRHVSGDHTGRLLFLDFHTGLGPWGHGELISKKPPGDPEFQRLRRWFGPAVKSTATGDSTSVNLTGMITGAVREALPDGEVTTVTAEFGTYPLLDVMAAVRADTRIHACHDPLSEEGRRVKDQLREAFYPADEDWQELCFIRGLQLMQRGIKALAE